MADTTQVLPQVVGCPRSGARSGAHESPSCLRSIHCRRRNDDQQQQQLPAQDQHGASDIGIVCELDDEQEYGTPEALSPHECVWAFVLLFFSALDLLGSVVLSLAPTATRACLCIALASRGSRISARRWRL